MRYRWIMNVNREQEQQVHFHDVVLPGACVACGGPLAARFGPRSGVGVCLACHVVSALALARGADGVEVGQLAAGSA
jgi:hypothetical protein